MAATRLPRHSDASTTTSLFASSRRGGLPRCSAVVAIALAAIVWSALPARAREVLGAGGRVSTGPVTSEASRKMVSRLRGLAADFRAAGIDRHNAAVRRASRYSTGTLKVDDA